MPKLFEELEGHRWVGSSLVRKRCVTSDDLEALPPERVERLATQIPDWTLAADGRSIERVVQFGSFQEALSFIGALGWLIEREGHHPDISLYFREVRIAFRTHALDALTENDFICATLVDELLAR